jgi:hypothetical protein
MAPEGASRCRAVASGLVDRSACLVFALGESARKLGMGGGRVKDCPTRLYLRQNDSPKIVVPADPRESGGSAGTHEHRPVIMGPRLRGDDRMEGAARPDRNFHDVKQPNSFPRPHCCVRALPLCFANPDEGWAERRETFGCGASAPVGRAMTRHVRRLRGALRPMTRDARLSALHRGGFGHRVRAFQSPASASARASAGIRIRLSELLAARS